MGQECVGVGAGVCRCVDGSVKVFVCYTVFHDMCVCAYLRTHMVANANIRM